MITFLVRTPPSTSSIPSGLTALGLTPHLCFSPGRPRLLEVLRRWLSSASCQSLKRAASYGFFALPNMSCFQDFDSFISQKRDIHFQNPASPTRGSSSSRTWEGNGPSGSRGRSKKTSRRRTTTPKQQHLTRSCPCSNSAIGLLCCL